MEIHELIDSASSVQRIYCGKCSSHLSLVFEVLDEIIAGVHFKINGLPFLRCINCQIRYLPDRSKSAILHLHRQAFEKGSDLITSDRKKTQHDFGFTKVPFIYDSDDYLYTPGLERDFDKGFLTPVFFNKEVLVKYDSHPSYRVQFASKTYGTIWCNDDFSVPFGINKYEKIVMWLGDISRLPTKEQYYLRSENVISDHCIGSEFYDGQIECIFTDLTPEDKLFKETLKKVS